MLVLYIYFGNGDIKKYDIPHFFKLKIVSIPIKSINDDF